jgi:hypothetical protein
MGGDMPDVAGQTFTVASSDVSIATIRQVTTGTTTQLTFTNLLGRLSFVDGDLVQVTGVPGTVQLNSLTYEIHSVSMTTASSGTMLLKDAAGTADIDSSDTANFGAFASTLPYGLVRNLGRQFALQTTSDPPVNVAIPTATYGSGATLLSGGSLFSLEYAGMKASIGDDVTVDSTKWLAYQSGGSAWVVASDSTTPRSGYGAYKSGGTVAKLTATVTDITQSRPAIVTAASHGFAWQALTARDPSNQHGFVNGDKVTITGVSGMTQINGNTYTVRKSNRTTFALHDAFDPSRPTDATVMSSYNSFRACEVSPNSVVFQQKHIAETNKVEFHDQTTDSTSSELLSDYGIRGHFTQITLMQQGLLWIPTG